MGTIPGVRGGGSGVSMKGDKGDGGLRGDRGLQGPKGDRGDRGLTGLKDGRDGKPGPPGLPGYTGKNLGQPQLFYRQIRICLHYNTDGNGFNSNGGRMAPGTITFQNTDAMIKSSLMNPVGTLAYVIDEEAVLVRVNKGWQYIALGTLLPLATQPPTTTTITPSYGPDLQASNLINNIQKPEFSLRMAALNEPYTGNLQGLRIADLNCHRQARRAGLIGTFKAFLSARIQNLDSIVRQEDRELPVVNTRGDVLFNSWNSIFNSQGGFFSQAPRIYSFSGKNVLNDPTWPQKAIWHGAKMDSIDTNCENWHSSASEKVGLGSSLLGNKLLDQEMYSCKQKNIVLCIEVLSPHESSRKRRDLITHNMDDDDADERER
ncbi:unnamed protein product [Diamesa tonsa]